MPSSSDFLPDRQPRPRPSKRPSRVLSTRDLSDHQRLRLAQEYLLDLDSRAAAQRVGLAPEIGVRWLALEASQREVAVAMRERAKRLCLPADEVLARWTAIARTDVNEIQQLRIACCKFCHGEDHGFQFTPHEWETVRRFHAFAYDDGRRYDEKGRPYVSLPLTFVGTVQALLDRALDAAFEAGRKGDERPPLDPLGGVGYDKRAAPDPDCPECFGAGLPWVVLMDTRHLSYGARMLYQGVKVNERQGTIEVLLRKQEFVEEMLAKHHGLFPSARQTEEREPLELTDDQLDAGIAGLVEQARARAALPAPSGADAEEREPEAAAPPP